MSIKEKALERGLEEHKRLLKECREEVKRLRDVLEMKEAVKPTARYVEAEEEYFEIVEDEQEES